MVQEDKLSAVLSEFAWRLATDFPIQSILDHLVQRIVTVLPITAAGVTLISEDVAPHYVAASDGDARRFEELQSALDEGPCTLAYNSGQPVAVPDLRADERFPRFGPAAVAAGLAAVFTFPLRHGDGRFGALDLYRDVPGAMAAHAMDAAQTLADVAAAYLLNAQARAEARSTADRFRHIALHDALTGLPNRVLLEQRIEHAAARARRSHSKAAILFLDLDRFKAVNDRHGHHVGDQLLLAVSQRLAGLVRPGDTLARVAGDEFVFLCEDLSDAGDAEVLADRIGQAFAAPFVLATTELRVTASIGMAFSGPGEEISDDLMIEADVAMYQTKRKGGAGHQVIDLREALKSTDFSALERDLRSALSEGHLEVAYQPIVRSADGLVTGVEALLRWMHPQRGPVPALTMVQLAEQIGLIAELGAWVLERSCRDVVSWLPENPGSPLDLAVNVSTVQLMSRDFATTVSRVLARTGMDPANLVLEMTESIFIDDSERAMAVLTDLRALGIRLALDDFGTGYSSLSYLRRLPIDIVKIDQGFIGDIGQAPRGEAIVAAVTNLAHVLGLTVIAEGVETECQRAEVIAMGCESAQGYLYAKPMSADDLRAQLGRAGPGPLHLPAVTVGAQRPGG